MSTFPTLGGALIRERHSAKSTMPVIIKEVRDENVNDPFYPCNLSGGILKTWEYLIMLSQ